MPDKALDDKPPEDEASPSSTEPPSPSVLDTPLPEEDREQDAEWFEDDLIVVKTKRHTVRVCAEADERV